MSEGALTRLFNALALPDEARVEQRVAKALLVERGDLPLADRRVVEAELDRLTWGATLKPATTGLAAYADDSRDYGQIVVMAATLKREAKAERLVEVIHRVVAHPLVLLAGDGRGVALSVGLKRRHEREAGRVVVERLTASPALDGGEDTLEQAFLASLPLAGVAAHDLWSLHTGWEERAEAYAAARIAGTFRLPRDAADADARRAALAAYSAQAREVAGLKKAAAREKRLAKQLDLAREVTSAEGRLADLEQTLA